MRTEHIRNKQDSKMLLVKNFYPYTTKPKLEYIGHITSSEDLIPKKHKHQVAEIMLLEKGKLNIEVENENIILNEKDFIIYNAEISHFEHSIKNQDVSLYYMGISFTNPEISDNVILPESYPLSYKSNSSFTTLKDLFTLALKESKNTNAYHFEIAQNVVQTILLYIYRLINDQTQESLLQSSQKTIKDILTFLDNNFEKEISLDLLAEKFYINKYYMSHIFSEQCGTTIIKYINFKKIEKAKELLKNTKLTISEICLKCGFTNENYFCRIFKNIENTTPSKFRKN